MDFLFPESSSNNDETCYSCWAGTVFLVWYLALYLRLVPAKICTMWFGVTMMLSIVCMAFFTFLCSSLRFLGVSFYTTSRMCNVVCSIFFPIQLALNPQIRIHHPKSKKAFKWTDFPPGAMICLNHTSFFDTFFTISVAPVRLLAQVRAIYKKTLEQTPIFGACYARCGHFPVFFKEEGNLGSFGVDQAKQEAVKKRMDEFVQKEKGTLMVFPEGRMNPEPQTLLPFRWGSIKYALENKMPMYFIVTWGCADAWPMAAGMGGLPSDVYYSLGKLDLPPGTDTADEKAIAALMQTQMQQVVEETRQRALRKE